MPTLAISLEKDKDTYTQTKIRNKKDSDYFTDNFRVKENKQK